MCTVTESSGEPIRLGLCHAASKKQSQAFASEQLIPVSTGERYVVLIVYSSEILIVNLENGQTMSNHANISLIL